MKYRVIVTEQVTYSVVVEAADDVALKLACEAIAIDGDLDTSCGPDSNTTLIGVQERDVDAVYEGADGPRTIVPHGRWQWVD
jgi:hypothetical protein